MSTIKPSILVVGLPTPLKADLPPMKVPWSDEPVNICQEIRDVTQKIKERGYEDFEVFGCEPEDLHSRLKDKITSKHWHAVIPGGGFKYFPEMTVGLEEIVNIVKDNSPDTRIMFTRAGPPTLLETIDRLEARMTQEESP